MVWKSRSCRISHLMQWPSRQLLLQEMRRDASRLKIFALNTRCTASWASTIWGKRDLKKSNRIVSNAKNMYEFYNIAEYVLQLRRHGYIFCLAK